MSGGNVIQFPKERMALGDLVNMSRRLLEAAEAGDWDLAGEIQPLRRERLEAFFADRDDSVSNEALAEGIRAMLAMDARVADLINARRQAILDEAGKLRLASNAMRTYAGHQG